MDTSIRLESVQEAQLIFGPADEHMQLIEQEFKVRVTVRGEHLKVSGLASNIKKASQVIEHILGSVRQEGASLSKADILYLVNNYKKGTAQQQLTDDFKVLSPSGRHTAAIGPKTRGQREYVEAIKAHDIVFGIGPAGTGKTYLAMACAVEALKKQEVRRIILTRPAIEARGESLGFLPGDMYEKISPYLRPLYDALYDMMEAERIEKYLETGIIEVAPLAYMRGRTLNEAFIILDEAQNCTAEQMKMFLTRLGFDSKAVITGDLTQSDLPDARPSGLMQATSILKDIPGIKFNFFTGADVVRHHLVQRIIEAYDTAFPKK